MTSNHLFWKLIKENVHPSWGYFGKSSKNIYNFLRNNATYLSMNPDTDVTNVSSAKYFIYFNFDVPHYIWWNQHNTVYTILVKVDILDACGTMICSYFGITILLFFMKIENAVLQILLKHLNEHIKLTPYSKMNVRLSAQVLSSVSKV